MSEFQKFSNINVLRQLPVTELTQNCSQEWLDEIDLKASVRRFIFLVDLELQESCPGALVEYEVLWDETVGNAGLSVGAPAEMAEDERQEKCDTVAAAFVEAHSTVKMEYRWQVRKQ